MSKKSPKLVITGSRGLIGRPLARHLSKRFQILELDLKLGHDLNDEKFVRNWFSRNTGLYGLVLCHAFNPAPRPGARSVAPELTPVSEIRAYLDTNLVSPFALIKEFVKNNRSGRVITLSSIYGHVSPRHDLYGNFVKPVGYSMTKGALALMTKYLAAYYAPNYLINSVSLGGIEDKKTDTKFRKKYASNIPIKRMMRVKETFPLFDFLLDPRNTYTTGADILSDGGWTAW